MQEQRLLVMPRSILERQAAPRAAVAVQLHAQGSPLRGLRKLREARQLTLAALALRTGLGITLLGELEARDHAPSPRTCDVLAEALGVAPDELFG